MFANRLRKNLKQLRRWLKKEDVTCYRLYDADMPEYAVAVDIYEDRVHVQEYQAPASVDRRQAERRLREVMRVLPEELDVEPDAIALKVRRRQKGSSQYQKLDRTGERFEVREGNCWFLVNLTDYLDTGLFLDHRPTRFMLQAMAEGKSFLNLFAYTGTATVHAVKGGATSSVTVDMSRTYLDWAQANLRLNRLAGPQHRFVATDVLQYLEREQGRYDLIFLDPPTFSTSKSMETTLDIQRDHVRLIRLAANLLSSGGILIFSNNFRKFRMDFEALPELEIEDITAATIPQDFARNPKIHNCWRITRR
jgi:23S rRNA (guanine2445-N2)-methyltransferase / 23S rRNA (guanine2069-N7)-methyltransferase